MDITTIGFDLAKTVFQVHGADGEGRAVLRRKLRRGKVLAFLAGLPSCLVGMEACASAHYWARELQALGHKVRLIPPQYVRPFVKTNKNDAADAEAICEAVTRPTMRFAPAKSAEQQSVLMLHRARELLVRQRTMVINALRGHYAELGLIVAQGASRVEELVAIIEDPGDERLPPLAREALGSLVEQLCSAQARIKQLEATLMAWHRSNQASRRLATIPGVGVITATALVATIGDGAQFRSGRQLSAWLGLVPRQHSSGGKDRLGRISKRGDGYIRRLLVHGARSVLRWRRAKPGTRPGWSDQLLARRPTNVVLVAMANKTARVARNGPVPDHGSPVAGTPAAKASPSSATPDRARCRCPRSNPPGASGNSARAAPRARPSGPRNKAGSSPRQRRRSRPRPAPTASGHKTHDPESAASPTSSPSGPPDHPSAVPSPSANPPANQGTRESDGADLINGLLRPFHLRWQGHEDRFDVAAGLEPECRAAVVD